MPSPPSFNAEASDAGKPSSEEGAAALALEIAKGFTDMPPIHGFPSRIPRPKSLLMDAASIERDIPPSLRKLLAEDSLAGDPFVREVAAAAYVLAQYGGQQKIAIGLPIDLRDGSPGGDAIGCHSAMVPIAIDCSVPTFAALVSSIVESRRVAQPLARIPFHTIVKASGINIHPGANPLFQIACVVDPPFALSLAGCECTQLAVAVPPQQLDLFLQFRPDSLRVGYATPVIGSDMVTSFVSSFVAFAERALQNPTADLSRLSILSAEEKEALEVQTDAADRPAFLKKISMRW